MDLFKKCIGNRRYTEKAQLSEEDNLFIMHNQGTSVQFQCYEDRSYYLCVNDDSLDIRKLENKEPNEEKNFYFRVSYLEEKIYHSVYVERNRYLLQRLGFSVARHQFPGRTEKKVNKAKAETRQAKRPKTAERIPATASRLGLIARFFCYDQYSIHIKPSGLYSGKCKRGLTVAGFVRSPLHKHERNKYLV
ncbi:hypothetical protein EK904_007307 [Melospiza melodia maxima]|nr:hypothetical protein EK904_007307 [Melospiza melodia maxima]